MKKLLIIAYKFPPINTMGSRRWAEMIPVLSKFYDVYIFTTESKGDLEIPVDESKIERCGLIENNLFDNSGQSRSGLHRFISTFTKEMRTIDSTLITWYWKYRKHFRKYFKEVNPDIVISTTVSIIPALFGYYAKKTNPDILWINDIRDSMSLYNEHEKNFFQRKLDRIIDKAILEKPDLLFTVSKTLSNLLSEFYNKEVATIYNGYSEDEIINKRINNTTPILYYAGRIYPHREQALYLLLESIKGLNVTLNIRLVGTKEQFNSYDKYCKKHYINNAYFFEPTSADVIHKEELSSDLLILLEEMRMDDDVSKGTLTGKLFEYLKMPVPILAICRSDSEIGEVIKETVSGVLLNNKKDIQHFIKNLSQFDTSKKKCEKYSRNNQAEIVVKYLKRFE